jgi:hypothetical protein
MSHIVRIKTQVRDEAAVHAACARLHLSPPEPGEFRLFAASAAGLAVRLPGWQYPVVCQTEVGELAYDNYGGAWGAPAELDKFLQAYAVEKTLAEARRQNCTVVEQRLPGGAIKLTLSAGDAR